MSWFHILSVIQIMWFALILHQVDNCQVSCFYKKKSQLSLSKESGHQAHRTEMYRMKFPFVSSMSATAALCVLESSGGSTSCQWRGPAGVGTSPAEITLTADRDHIL